LERIGPPEAIDWIRRCEGATGRGCEGPVRESDGAVRWCGPMVRVRKSGSPRVPSYEGPMRTVVPPDLRSAPSHPAPSPLRTVWMQFLVDLKDQTQQETSTYGNQTFTYTTVEYISAVNADTVKGLIWICSHFHDRTTIQTAAALAERAFKKIPGKGPAATSLGNGCLFMLYKSKGLDGIGQLSRLKVRIKQNNTQNLIERYLKAAATEQNVTIGEIEGIVARSLHHGHD